MMRLGVVLLLLTSSAGLVAHPGHGVQSQGWAGASHPWSGLDHWMVTLVIGLWASGLPQKGRWLVPLSFAALFFLTSILATVAWMPANQILFDQTALILLGLGAFMVFTFRMSLVPAVCLAGFLAFWHGLCHGTGSEAGTWQYLLGLGFGTFLLHGAGFGLGLLLQRNEKSLPLRWAGGAIVCLGILFLVPAL